MDLICVVCRLLPAFWQGWFPRRDVGLVSFCFFLAWSILEKFLARSIRRLQRLCSIHRAHAKTHLSQWHAVPSSKLAWISSEWDHSRTPISEVYVSQATKVKKYVILPVYIPDGSIQSLEADSSTTSSEMIQKIARNLNIKDSFGFSIYICIFDKVGSDWSLSSKIWPFVVGVVTGQWSWPRYGRYNWMWTDCSYERQSRGCSTLEALLPERTVHSMAWPRIGQNSFRFDIQTDLQGCQSRWVQIQIGGLNNRLCEQKLLYIVVAGRRAV